MNAKQKLHQVHLQEWTVRFADQKASGLTVRQWCEQNNLSFHTYNYWKHLLKEEASGIEDILTDSETFSPVIRSRETVREQRKLHVSHSAEQEQPALPQLRPRQPQTASMPADIEPTKPEVPQPPLPDIKSKQKYIAAQQPTQVTPVQANLQQAARQTGMKAAHGEPI